MLTQNAIECWHKKYCIKPFEISEGVCTVPKMRLIPEGSVAFECDSTFSTEEVKAFTTLFSQFDYFTLYNPLVESEGKGLFRGTRRAGVDSEFNNYAELSGSSLCYFSKPSNKVLMQLRDNNTRFFPNHYSFPGGIKRNAEESYPDTALREFNEETGVQLNPSEITPVATHTNFNGDSFYIVHYYLACGKVENFRCFEGESMVLLSKAQINTELLVPYADIVGEYCFELGESL